MPASLAVLIEPLAGMVDTSFMGRISETYLAAIGVGVTVVMSLSWMFNLLLYQVTADVAKNNSQNNRFGLIKSIKVAMISSIIISIPVSALILYFLDDILINLIGVDGEVLELSKSYIIIRIPFFWLFLLSSINLGVLRGDLGHKKVLYLTLFETILNIGLTWVLVKYYDLSIVGAAVGTVFAKLASYFVSCKLVIDNFDFKLGEIIESKVDIGSIKAFGFKSSHMFITLCLQALFILAVAYMGRKGSLELASYQVCLELWMLFSFVVEGIAIICTADGGSLFHRGDYKKWFEFTFSSIKASFLLGTVFLFLFAVFPETFIRIFTDQEEVISFSLKAMFIISLMQPLNAVVFALDGIMFGLERFDVLAKATSLGLLLALALMYLAPIENPLHSVWYAMAVMNLCRLSFSLPTYIKIKRKTTNTYSRCSIQLV